MIRDEVKVWAHAQNKQRKAYWYLAVYFLGFFAVACHAVPHGYFMFAFMVFLIGLPVVDLARLDLFKLKRSQVCVPDSLLVYLAESKELDAAIKAKLAQDLCDLYMLGQLTFKGLFEIDAWYLERQSLARAFEGDGFRKMKQFRTRCADDLISPEHS